MEFFDQLDSTFKLLAELQKIIEDNLHDYHDICVKHRMGIRMDTELKVKLTMKNNKAVYTQRQSMPIHMKKT